MHEGVVRHTREGRNQKYLKMHGGPKQNNHKMHEGA